MLFSPTEYHWSSWHFSIVSYSLTDSVFFSRVLLFMNSDLLVFIVYYNLFHKLPSELHYLPWHIYCVLPLFTCFVIILILEFVRTPIQEKLHGCYVIFWAQAWNKQEMNTRYLKNQINQPTNQPNKIMEEWPWFFKITNLIFKISCLFKTKLKQILWERCSCELYLWITCQCNCKWISWNAGKPHS